MKKQELKQLIEECITELKEDSKREYEKRKSLEKMADNDTSFAGWMKKHGELVGKTRGDEGKILKLIDDAIKNKELKISDKYYNILTQQVKDAKNPVKKMSVMYNNMLKPMFGSVK